MAIAAAVEAVGARFNEQASSFTAISSTMLLALANVDFRFAVKVINRTPSRFTASTNSMSSSVSPLDEIATSTSSPVSIPKSPCNASEACKNNDGVPILANVAAVFRPINPDLPSPVTTTRPLHEYSISTAFSKRASSRSINPAIASDSIRNTRRAVARLIARPTPAPAPPDAEFFATTA